MHLLPHPAWPAVLRDALLVTITMKLRVQLAAGSCSPAAASRPGSSHSNSRISGFVVAAKIDSSLAFEASPITFCPNMRSSSIRQPQNAPCLDDLRR